MSNVFGLICYQNDLLYQTQYWSKNNRYYKRDNVGGVEYKAKRISKKEYNAALAEYNR